MKTLLSAAVLCAITACQPANAESVQLDEYKPKIRVLLLKYAACKESSSDGTQLCNTKEGRRWSYSSRSMNTCLAIASILKENAVMNGNAKGGVYKVDCSTVLMSHDAINTIPVGDRLY